MTRATVTVVSPLAVRLDGSATAVPARNGLPGYTPTVNARVLVELVAGTLYVLGVA